MRDLIRDPLWRPDDLGRPIPESPHAVSVCLPTWRDHVGYEEQEPRVLEKLQAGYPRFVYNPFCRELFDACRRDFADESESCQLYPSLAAAERFCEFFTRQTGQRARLRRYGMGELYVVCFPTRCETVAKDYWQHSGEGISSRQAEVCLVQTTGIPVENFLPMLRERIARLTGVGDECVSLYPTGMAAIYAAYRALEKIHPDRKSIQFGFPYVDMLKIQQKFGAGVHLYARGTAADLDAITAVLEQEPINGIFTEFPSNPLLQSPDLHSLSRLARGHGCPLIVDETIASYVNVDLMSAADVVCTSLTKFFSGVGDVMGGALILNPDSPFSAELSELLTGEGDELLWGADLAVLEANSRDFEQRVRTINAGAERLADFLNEHPRVSRVYYPKFDTPEAFHAFRRPGGGYGGLLSFTLHDEKTESDRFFDQLRVCKGPNLGMSYSLACFYTLLAHYRELDFAESCGMSRHLIRVSVGTEEPDELIERFQDALNNL